MRILLVEDTEDALALYKLGLEIQGFTVSTATDGLSALEIVEQQEIPFDAIVLDIEMPRLNGWDTLKAIRQLPQGQQPAILLLTAYRRGLQRETAQQAGADVLYYKPLLPEKLAPAIREAVARRWAQSAT